VVKFCLTLSVVHIKKIETLTRGVFMVQPVTQTNKKVWIELGLAQSGINSQPLQVTVTFKDESFRVVTLLDKVKSMTNKSAKKGGKTSPKSVELHNSLMDPNVLKKCSKAGRSRLKK